MLHECLVHLPHEDFIYLGDTRNFPVWAEIVGRGATPGLQATGFLVRQGVKLIVVACNSAGAAALPQLQASFSTPVVGVVIPGARAAIQETRNRRVGIIATEATVRSNAYQNALHTLDAGVEVFPVACPRLAPSDPGRRRLLSRHRGRREGICRSPQGSRGGHGDPRLHSLPLGDAHAPPFVGAHVSRW